MFTYFLLLTAYCDHIWSWSLNPKPIANSPPNIFDIMKPSSVSLIALAAIASTVIAAPRPLHGCALEDVNSLSERDVDVYSRDSGLAPLEREVDHEFDDDLCIRTSPAEAAEAHDKAAAARREAAGNAGNAAKKAREAAERAREAAKKAYVIAGDTRHTTTSTNHHDYSMRGYHHGMHAAAYYQKGEQHENEARNHANHAKYHTDMASWHRSNAAHPGQLDDSVRSAGDSRAEAEASSHAWKAVTTRYDGANGVDGVIPKLMDDIRQYDAWPAVQDYNRNVRAGVEDKRPLEAARRHRDAIAAQRQRESHDRQ